MNSNKNKDEIYDENEERGVKISKGQVKPMNNQKEKNRKEK